MVYGAHEMKRVWNRVAHSSYSLNREDLILDKLCAKNRAGFYVDVGANDPLRLSNTQHFYKKGWWGVNIEPNPLAQVRFNKLRPRDINVCAAVGPVDGQKLPFYVMFPTTISTFSEKYRDLNLKRGCEHVETLQLPLEKLGTILAKHVPPNIDIDFMSIDTEGHDMIALETNDWDRFRPRVLVIESATQFGGDTELYADKDYFSNDVYKHLRFLNDKGYDLVYHNGIDGFYFRRN